MAKTVLSSTSAYCTAAQMAARFDERSLGRLLSDSDTTALTEAQVLASTDLAAYLKEASGRVESACLRGGRYTPADLAALQTAGTNGGEMLAGLVADLAMWRVWRRRPRKANDAPPLDIRDALGLLQQLADGEAIFGLQETADAGRIDHGYLEESDLVERNNVVEQARRRFGRRSDRGRQGGDHCEY